MSSRVLEFIRREDPRFRDVPDAELTRFIGTEAPQFLQDREFAANFKAYGQMQANDADTAAVTRLTGPRGLVKETVDAMQGAWSASAPDGQPVADPAAEAQLRAFDAQWQMARELGRGDLARQTRPDELGIGQEVRGVGRAVKRGALQGLQALDTMRLANVAARPPQFSDARRAFLAGRFAEQEQALYGGRPERLAELERAAESTPMQIARKISGRQQRIDALPPSPDLENLHTDFWRTLGSHPVETIATVVAESLPQAAPGILGAAAGGGPVPVGLNSLGIEYAHSLLESAGPDVVRDPAALARWFAVPENQAAAKAKAVKRGLPVAAADAATAGLAGRFLNRVIGQGRRAVGVATAKELGMQMGGGMAGEAAGQLTSEGRITSVPDIVLEGIAELGTAPGEVFGNLRNEVGSRVRQQMAGRSAEQGAGSRRLVADDEIPDYRDTRPAAPPAPLSAPADESPTAPVRSAPAEPPAGVSPAAVVVRDVTPEGFGPVETESGPIREQRLPGESLDAAIVRKVGYQVDNGRVRIYQEGDQWVAQINQVEGQPRKVKSLRKQQVYNLAFNELYPNTQLVPAEPPAGVSPAPGKFKFVLYEQQGGGWYVTSDWRSAFVKLPDLWNRVDLLRAVANNRGSKASLQDLQDALERGRQMLEAMRRDDSQAVPDLTNLGWDISRNPAANAALKAEAIKFREDAFEYYSRPPDEAIESPSPTAPVRSAPAEPPAGVSPAPGKVEPKPPELMTPEEWRPVPTYTETVNRIESAADFNAEEFAKPYRNAGSQQLLDAAEFIINRGGERNERAIRRAKQLINIALRDGNPRTPEGHLSEIKSALKIGNPVSAVAVDAYGTKLPEGYVREGDRYVYRPGAPAQQQAAGAAKAEPAVATPAEARPDAAVTIPKATPANPPRKPRQFRAREMVGDILDDIEQAGGLISKSAARKRGLLAPDKNGPEYDDAPTLAHPAHNFIYGNGRGGSGFNTPDKLVKTLAENNPKYAEMTVWEMWERVRQASKGRVGDARTRKTERKLADQMAREEVQAQKDFNRATQKQPGDTAVAVDELTTGHELVIAGEKFQVEDIDPDTGDVVLKDGPRFGRRVLEAGKVIYVEKMEAAEPSTDFVPSEPEAPAAKSPKLGQGQNQGDLIASTQVEDFALAGERGTDMERLQAAKAKAEREAAEAKAIQDRQQGDMFGRSAGAEAPAKPDLITKLESLKVDTSGKVFDAIQGIPVMVWNGALTAAQVALRAGAQVVAAIDAAVQHIRRRHRGAFDEQAVRAELERDLLTEVRFEAGSPLPDFQPYATAQRMFTRAFGAETLPWVGRLFGPRGKRVLTVVDRALVTWAAEAKGIGPAVASSIGTELAGRVDAVWRANAQGDLNVTPRTPGQSLKVSDVLEALQQDADAYVLTPEQRRVWDRILQPLLRRRRELVARHRLAQTEDAEGNLLAYFPRIVTRNPHTPADALNSGGAGVGGRKGFQKPRAFRTERQGWEAGYEYETSIERRLVTSIERLYHAMADQRLAQNPDLQGRTRAEVVAELTEYHAEELGAGTMTEAEIQRAADGIMNDGRVNRPAFAGRTFARPNPHGGPGLDLTIKTQLERAFPQAESNLRHAIMQGNNLVKALRLGFDLGAPLTQGLPLFFRNPVMWGDATWQSLRALFTPLAFARRMQRPENQRAVRELAQLGSPVGQLPEMLSGLGRGEILDRVPGVNRLKTAFGRQFSTFMDTAKVELWKAHRDLYPENQWPALAQSLESMLLSGRMEAVGVGRNQAGLERVLLLAPSYYRGAVNLVSAIGRPGVSGHVARRALLHFAAGSTAAFIGVGLSLGMGEDELKRRFNPNHPNFMQWTVTLDNGRQMNFGFGGIMRSWIRLLGSMVRTSLETPKDWLALDSTRNPIARWLRGHLAPIPGFAMDLTGRDFMGRQTDLTDLPEQLVPLWAAQMVDKTGRLPPTWRELTASWTGLSGYSQSPAQYIRRRAAEFDRSKDGPQPKRVPEDSHYSRLEWALRLDNPKAAKAEYERLIERLPPAPNKTPQRMILEHFHRLATDNAFSRYRAREAEFKRGLTADEQELYRLAQQEQRALYSRLKKAITPKE